MIWPVSPQISTYATLWCVQAKFITEFLKFGGHSCSNCQGGLPSYTHTGLDSPKSEAALFPGDLVARLLSILVCVFHWGQAGEWLSLATAADDGSQGPWMAGGPPPTTVIHSSRGDAGGYDRGSGYGRSWQSNSGPAPGRQIDPNHMMLLVWLSWVYTSSVIPRPSTCTPPVFDHLQHAKMEGEGLGNFIT